MSSSLYDFKNETLKSMLSKYRKNNKQNLITGILLYIDGNFLQVLEGEKQNVQLLFEKIKLDIHHHQVITLFDASVNRFQFKDWSMGFARTDYDQLKKITKIEDFCSQNFLEYTDEMILKLIDSFIKTHRDQLVIY